MKAWATTLQDGSFEKGEGHPFAQRHALQDVDKLRICDFPALGRRRNSNKDYVRIALVAGRAQYPALTTKFTKASVVHEVVPTLTRTKGAVSEENVFHRDWSRAFFDLSDGCLIAFQ